ncbi:MAG: DNA-processing protein DprA [Desulfobulbaceae bacterium]|jgi:DNA processing protein|nr:DNA-processing protein DprA [Desulfobulbaceae bacterium]
MHRDILQDWLTLYFVEGLGCTLVYRLIGEFGSPAGVLAAPANRLRRVEGIGPGLAARLTAPSRLAEARERARRELRLLADRNICLLCLDDPCYPSLLRTIDDPPFLLYCRGDLDCLKRPAVALVGSRAASVYGKRISHELAGELARRGFCVVSGLALGIDGEAHAGALAAGGPTVGVLGCGIDVVYPRRHASLFRDMERRALLISEYALGVRPEGFRFPERNRIISGLSLGVIVVEAGMKSGSLITARLALEQGREVFAVPGRIDSARSRGTHRLLQEGAKLVQTVDDIIEELRLPGAASPATSGPAAAPGSREEQRLLSCLDVYPSTIDELVRESGFSQADVFDLLLSLELKGMIRQLPGQQYERLVRD